MSREEIKSIVVKCDGMCGLMQMVMPAMSRESDVPTQWTQLRLSGPTANGLADGKDRLDFCPTCSSIIGLVMFSEHERWSALEAMDVDKRREWGLDSEYTRLTTARMQRKLR